MMTLLMNYSTLYDSNYYPMLCTNRYGTICPCSINNSSCSQLNPISNILTPPASPSNSINFQSTNSISTFLNSSGLLDLGKVLSNPTNSLINQNYPVIINGISNTPMCHTAGTAKRFIFNPGSWKQSYGMETVWIQEFSKLFIQYLPHSWYLMPVEDPPIPEKSLYSFFDSAKVRFCCEQCGHGWTSMKGRVAFWFDLTYTCGILAFKLYGQTCEKCKNPERYEQPMWYPEEVVKVLKNVFVKIGQIYYGYLQTVQIERGRRTGKPRNPHNSSLCQACKDGVCVFRCKV